MRQSALIAALCLLSLAACTKEKREAVVATGGGTGPATLSTIQSDVFRLSCGTSGCHDNRANPAGNLDMSSYDATYAQLVNRNSVQATAMKLVNPGDPETSYLMNKLYGTHSGVGGNGARMPQYAAMLTSSDIERIETWITDGALRN